MTTTANTATAIPTIPQITLWDTTALIAAYTALDERRVSGGHADGGMYRRQRKIDRIVDELMRRADDGDSEADAFFDI